MNGSWVHTCRIKYHAILELSAILLDKINLYNRRWVRKWHNEVSFPTSKTRSRWHCKDRRPSRGIIQITCSGTLWHRTLTATTLKITLRLVFGTTTNKTDWSKMYREYHDSAFYMKYIRPDQKQPRNSEAYRARSPVEPVKRFDFRRHYHGFQFLMHHWISGTA